MDRVLCWDLLRASDLYRMVLSDLGFDLDLEWDASQIACIVARTINVRDPLEVLYEIKNISLGRKAYILGAGPNALKGYKDIESGSLVFCADGACSLIRDLRGVIAISITDLDGGIEPADLVFSRDGYLVIQIHGDNYRTILSILNILKRWRERVILSTQVLYPCSGLLVIPGFTDGDRAYVLAKALGISEITPIGMDLDSEFSTYLSKNIYGERSPATIWKLRKLRWGLRIVSGLYMLSIL
ncbi:MAG: 6-hydroxymethylpterin diphosphokinase MptE-like protein [Desulfurococcales archaeon]|nr:6-hydroxymethylpterin diphosphokinase MptE-like protein [Desulfurococcales archaeon]